MLIIIRNCNINRNKQHILIINHHSVNIERIKKYNNNSMNMTKEKQQIQSDNKNMQFQYYFSLRIALEKWGLMNVHKVWSLIILCSPPRLISDHTFRLNSIMAKKRLPFKEKYIKSRNNYGNRHN